MYIISTFKTILCKNILSLLKYVLKSTCFTMKVKKKGRIEINSINLWPKFRECVFQNYFKIFKILNANKNF